MLSAVLKVDTWATLYVLKFTETSVLLQIDFPVVVVLIIY